MKLSHSKRRPFKRGVALQEFRQDLLSIIFAQTTQREMRMKMMDIDCHIHRKQRFIDLLAKLEETRVPISGSSPDDFCRTARRKNPDLADG